MKKLGIWGEVARLPSLRAIQTVAVALHCELWKQQKRIHISSKVMERAFAVGK